MKKRIIKNKTEPTSQDVKLEVKEENEIKKNDSKPKMKSKPCMARIKNTNTQITSKFTECSLKAYYYIGDEEEGFIYICKACYEKYAEKETNSSEWLGFFDIDPIPK